MADNIPNAPAGAVPPKPSEAAKVQPKKETVRINLPPKPSASPTIKLPTLPSAAPRPAAAPVSATAAPAAAPAAPPPAPRATPAVAGAAAARVAAPSAAAPARSAVAAPAQAPRAPMVVGIGGLDKGLIMAAAISGLIALGSVAYLIWLLPDTAK